MVLDSKKDSDGIARFNRTSLGTLAATIPIQFCDDHAIGKYPMLSEPALRRSSVAVQFSINLSQWEKKLVKFRSDVTPVVITHIRNQIGIVKF